MTVDTHSSSSSELKKLIGQIPVSRSLVTAVILLVALIGFEMFNYSTTVVALTDLLGDLTFAGLKWATILAIAFCGIDFAGVARLFMPEEDTQGPKELWFLFGAWLLAATMNATLTWWGVAMSISSHSMRSTAIIDAHILTDVVPVFVAVMVWVTRILLIGSFSFSGKRLFAATAQPVLRAPSRVTRSATHYLNAPAATLQAAPAQPARSSHKMPSPAHRPASQPVQRPQVGTPMRASQPARPEPEYVADPAFSPQPVMHTLAGKPDANRPNRQF
jgi:hypothetical protein